MKRILLNERQASDATGLTVDDLRKRRENGLRPRFLKVGKGIFYDQDDIGAFLEARQRLSEEKLRLETILNTRVSELYLSNRILKLLKNDNIVFVWDLVQRTERELLKIPGFGRKSLNGIKEALEEFGLYLGMNIDNKDWKERE